MNFRKFSTNSLVALGFAMNACAADTSEPTTTQTPSPAPEASSEALTASATFLVVYKLQQLPSSAAADIAAAGGSVIASYPALGVVVAQASTKAFVTKLSANLWVDGVAPTTGAGVSALTVKMPGGFASVAAASSTTSTTSTTPAISNGSTEPLDAMQWNMAQIHAGDARKVTAGNKSVIVGVLDSGIDDSVPDLKGQVDHARSATCIGGVANTDPTWWSNDVIGHGTHVAGLIAAKENGKGIVGVAPGVTLAAVKLSEDGFIYPEAVVCGLNWAATHGFDLVNASLFVDPWYYNCPSDPTQAAIMKAVQRAVTYATQKGVTVIAAASNENQDLAHIKADPFSPTDAATISRSVDNSCKLLPVQLNDVIGVSAVDGNAHLSYYSNYGLGSIDIAAPGGDLHVPMPGNGSGQIVSTIPSYSFYYQVANGWNGRVGIGCTDGKDPNAADADPSTCAETYALLQGTSMATPHVTGVAALIISRYGKMPSSLLLAKLQLASARDYCPSGVYQPYPSDMPAETCQNSVFGNGFYGAGLLDARASVH